MKGNPEVFEAGKSIDFQLKNLHWFSIQNNNFKYIAKSIEKCLWYTNPNVWKRSDRWKILYWFSVGKLCWQKSIDFQWKHFVLVFNTKSQVQNVL